jgi:hypothetical protein
VQDLLYRKTSKVSPIFPIFKKRGFVDDEADWRQAALNYNSSLLFEQNYANALKIDPYFFGANQNQ